MNTKAKQLFWKSKELNKIKNLWWNIPLNRWIEKTNVKAKT